jgi:hypothetical protein
LRGVFGAEKCAKESALAGENRLGICTCQSWEKFFTIPVYLVLARKSLIF